MPLMSFSKAEELNMINTFFNRFASKGKFDSLTLEKIDEIKKDVELFKNNLPSTSYHYRLEVFKIIHFLNVYVQSGRYQPDQEIAFFVMALDPKFKMTKFYTTIQDQEELKRKITDEFGIFNSKLLRLEILFSQKYLKLLKELSEKETSLLENSNPMNAPTIIPNPVNEIDDNPPKL